MIASALLMAAAVLAAPPCNLTTGEISRFATGHQFTEGPVYTPNGWILFTDIPANKILAEDGKVFREPSNNANGLTYDYKGRLLAAEHSGRRVSRTEADGSITVLAETFQGKKLNSPNDLVVRTDGAVYFTDPPYGGNPAELDFNGVYLIQSDGSLHVLRKDYLKPNGIALSPDEKILYVADSEGNYLRAAVVAASGHISGDWMVADVPGPDGIKVDVEGNIWVAANDGVRVISPKGELLETVVFPEQPSNLCFGGPDGKTLYVTARTSVYKISTTIQGVFPLKPAAARSW